MTGTTTAITITTDKIDCFPPSVLVAVVELGGVKVGVMPSALQNISNSMTTTKNKSIFVRL